MSGLHLISALAEVGSKRGCPCLPNGRLVRRKLPEILEKFRKLPESLEIFRKLPESSEQFRQSWKNTQTVGTVGETHKQIEKH